MFKRVSVSLLIILVGLVFIAGCSDPKPVTKEEQLISIGLILPLKGELALYGELGKNAIDSQVDIINSNGGLLGRQLEAIPGDDASTGDKVSAAIAQNFSGMQKVSAVVGPYTEVSATSAALVCQANKTPMVAIRASGADITKTGDYIFRTCYVDNYQGTILGKFAVQELKAKKVAVIYNKADSRAPILIKNFRTEIEKAGGEIISTLSYDNNAKENDYKKLADRIAEQKPSAVLLPDFADRAGLVIKYCAEADVKTAYLGTDLLNADQLLKIAGEAGIGTYITTHFSPEDPDQRVKDFVELYEGDYGNKPGPSAALAYDAFNLVIDAMKRANSTDPIKVRDALAKTKSYKGVTGTFTFDNDRNPIKGGTILKVIDGGQKFEKRIQP